jgi:hypothetical protein
VFQWYDEDSDEEDELPLSQLIALLESRAALRGFSLDSDNVAFVATLNTRSRRARDWRCGRSCW